MTRVSRSDPGVGPQPRTEHGFGRLAWLLLLLAVVMCAAACPIPDDFVAVNNPPYIDQGAIEPSNKTVHLADCTLDPPPTLSFSVEAAVLDPDVNDDAGTMFYAWYVSTSDTDENGEPIERLVLRESPSFEFTCDNLNFSSETPTILTVYVLDRDPVSTVDEAVKIPGPDGFAVTVSWVVEVVR